MSENENQIIMFFDANTHQWVVDTKDKRDADRESKDKNEQTGNQENTPDAWFT